MADCRKDKLPDIGEFLPLIFLSNYDWKKARLTFVKEAFARMVKWAAEKHSRLFQRGFVTDKDVTDFLKKNFESGVVGMRLFLFNLEAARTFIFHIRKIDERCGVPPIRVIQGFQSRLGDIKRVNS